RPAPGVRIELPAAVGTTGSRQCGGRPDDGRKGRRRPEAAEAAAEVAKAAQAAEGTRGGTPGGTAPGPPRPRCRGRQGQEDPHQQCRREARVAHRSRLVSYAPTSVDLSRARVQLRRDEAPGTALQTGRHSRNAPFRLANLETTGTRPVR